MGGIVSLPLMGVMGLAGVAGGSACWANDFVAVIRKRRSTQAEQKYLLWRQAISSLKVNKKPLRLIPVGGPR